jgi:hypothetical protein
MTSPEYAFFVNCKFCQSFFPASKVRDLTFVDDFVKFTCNRCNYRQESLLYTKEQMDTGFGDIKDFGVNME